MKITLNRTSSEHALNANVATRCPHCGHNGIFLNVGANIHSLNNVGNAIQYYLGIRKCPNTNCNGHLFFILDSNQKVLLTSPSETIPFDPQNIPPKVLNAFEEAIKCHSNSCFIASAIMIRKTLEEISTERGVTGRTLKDKLQDLGEKIFIPKELISGMDELRLLGNDAAHIEAQTFDEIGKEEIELSLDLTKEILKAVYQYENLLSRLKNLKDKNKKATEA